MPRNLAKEKEVKLTNEDLERMVEQYVQLKEKEKEIKDDSSALNTQIKSLMTELGVTECGPAKLTMQKRESFDEEGIIDFLRRNHHSRLGIIKTKEYVDWDKMEDAIYNGKLTASEVKALDEYKSVQEIPTLRIGKAKK